VLPILWATNIKGAEGYGKAPHADA